MDQLPEKFQCPNCFVSVPVPERGRSVICDACQTNLDIVGHLCANCRTYHEEAVPLCETCGEPMTKVCRHCRTLNWAGNSHCIACKAGLDAIETLSLRSTEGTTAVAQQQMREAHTIKWQEELLSAQRMEKLEEKETARQAEMRRREQILQQKKKQMWLKTAVTIILFLMIVAAIILLT